MADNVIFLRLEGSLQSWGEQGRLMTRSTALRPTKSGVMGLCCAALGWRNGMYELGNQVKMGVRTERPGTLIEDFHTVIGGTRSANNKLRPATLVTWRYYLSGASFLVALKGKESTIGALAWSLQDPVYPLCLGRFGCIPSRPIYEGTGTYHDLQAALSPGEIEVECEIEDADGFRIDRLANANVRAFRPRPIRTFKIGLTE